MNSVDLLVKLGILFQGQGLSTVTESFFGAGVNFDDQSVSSNCNTGPGKGKTTAALGTAFRAAGNGMRVLILQFLKGSWHYGELDSAAAMGEDFVIRQLGRGFVKVGGAETDPEDLRMVEEAWTEAAIAILSGEWDLIVLDEINYAIGYKMLDPEKVAYLVMAGRKKLGALAEGQIQQIGETIAAKAQAFDTVAHFKPVWMGRSA